MASLHVLQVTEMLTFCYKAWDGPKESSRMLINSVCYFGDFNRHLQRAVQQCGHNTDLHDPAGILPLIVCTTNKTYTCAIFTYYYVMGKIFTVFMQWTKTCISV